MTTNSLIRVSSKKPITPKAPSSTLDVQYPSDWFKNNKNSKPILNLTLVSPDIETAAKALSDGIVNNTIHFDVAKTFLYYFAKTLDHELDTDWTSYGVEIGKAQSKITPLDLVKANVVTTLKEVTGGTATAKDYPWLAGYALCIYRLVRAGIHTYRTQLAHKITSQLKSVCATARDVSEVVDIYMGWPNDKGYNTLVAMYDMFFNRFPLHPYANLRIGTTGSRFRDCAALLSYGYLLELLGMEKTTDVMDWVFISQIGNNIDKMMDTEDELIDPFSYFPYQVDLGLVLKSAYSATANPYFFEWVHLIGALLRSTRSMQAKHIHDGRTMELLANAACVAYAFSSNFEFQKVYTEDGAALVIEPDDSDDSDVEQDEMMDDILKSRDPVNTPIEASKRLLDYKQKGKT